MTTNALSIRTARAADIPALIGLLRQLTALEEDFAFAEAEHRAGLAQLIAAQPATAVLVAQEAEGIVGMCTGQIVISTAVGAGSVWVEDVVVDSRLRGSGIGTRLLEELANWARGRGARRMQLLADLDNARAIAFYERSGWARTNFGCFRQLLP